LLAVGNWPSIRGRVIFIATLLLLLLNAPAAYACDERGCFGGVQGWGGLFRDNRDPGSFPTYVAVSGWDRGNVWVMERPPVLFYAPTPVRRPQARIHTGAWHDRRHRRALSSGLACAAQRPCFCCH
jgi:hypothetical protein